MKKTFIAATLGLAAIAASAEAKDWTHVTIATEGAFAPWKFTEADGTTKALSEKWFGFDVTVY